MRFFSTAFLISSLFLTCFDISSVANGFNVNCTSNVDSTNLFPNCEAVPRLLRSDEAINTNEEERLLPFLSKLKEMFKSILTRTSNRLSMFSWQKRGKTPEMVFDEVFQYEKGKPTEELYADLRKGLESPKLPALDKYHHRQGKSLIDELMNHYKDKKLLAFALFRTRNPKLKVTHETLREQYFKQVMLKHGTPQSMFADLGVTEAGVKAFQSPAVEILIKFIPYYNKKMGTSITLLEVMENGFGGLSTLAPILVEAKSSSKVAEDLQKELVQTFLDGNYNLKQVLEALGLDDMKPSVLFRFESLDTLDMYNRWSKSKLSLLESLKKGFGERELALLLEEAKPNSQMARDFQKDLVQG